MDLGNEIEMKRETFTRTDLQRGERMRIEGDRVRSSDEEVHRRMKIIGVDDVRFEVYLCHRGNIENQPRVLLHANAGE